MFDLEKLPTKEPRKSAVAAAIAAGDLHVWPDLKGKPKYTAKLSLESAVGTRMDAVLESIVAPMDLEALAAIAELPKDVSRAALRAALVERNCGEWSADKGKRLYFTRTPSRIFIREHLDSIQQHLSQQPAPIPVADLLPLLQLPLGIDLKALQDLLAAEGLYPSTEKKLLRIWNQSPESLARNQAFLAAGESLHTLKTLPSAVAKRTAGIAPAQAKGVVESLIAKGDLKVLGKNILNPARPQPFLQPIADCISQLRAAQVPEDALRNAVLDLLPSADPQTLLAILQTRERTAGQHFPIEWLRRDDALQSWDKLRFDRALLQLRDRGQVQLHYHDAPNWLNDEQRANLVADDQGIYYTGVAWN
jgi:hypothetical protein